MSYSRICQNGVCKGKTWEESYRFITAKHGEEYFHEWSKRVIWLDSLFDTVLAEYEKSIVRPNPSMGKRTLVDWVNADGFIHTGPGYLQWDLWVGNVELARRFCETQNGGKEMIWWTLSKCWNHAYFGGGGLGKDVEKFRKSISV